MFKSFTKTLTKNKHVVVLAIAVLAVLAYAVPYGMDVEAQNTNNNGKHYGWINGDGYGLSCDHFKGKGPVRCR